MTEVANLTELRNLPITTESVYVKKYEEYISGGEGFFIWKTEDIFQTGTYSTENFGTIIKSNLVPSKEGSWVRQYDGFINVSFFGANGVGNDFTLNIQRAIDFASLNANTDNAPVKGSTVFIPNGSYVLTNIILKDGVTVLGESLNKTNIYSPGATSTQYLFEIESGPVFINISNLNLIGNDTDKGCFLFRSQNSTSSPFHGGLWNSRISNINITGFKGNGIYLYGGGDGSEYLLPNQFNILENVRVFKNSDFTYALYMTGQNGQISFINCEFDGFFRNGSYSKGQNIRIHNEKQYTSAVVSFINCTCQDADYGLFIEWAENITIDNCWFENLGVAITVKSNDVDGNDILSKSINILNSRFANAAGFGSLNAPNNIKVGQCISVNKSSVNIYNNYVAVSEPNGIYLNNNSAFLNASNNLTGGINIANNTFQVAKLGKTFGVMQVINVVTNTIDCFGSKVIFVNGSTSQITTIKSSINAGELLNIRANGSSITFKNSNNIFFLSSNVNQTITLNNGENATFIKVDNVVGINYETYQLVSILKILP